jgi:hypothetical protein
LSLLYHEAGARAVIGTPQETLNDEYRLVWRLED